MTISKEICTTMSHWGSVPRTGLASFLMHLCAALVDREAFFGRNFGAVFEHAKTLIPERHYTVMPHPVMVPRAGLASFLMHLCAALVNRVAFFWTKFRSGF